jgi:hypothetical protein
MEAPSAIVILCSVIVLRCLSLAWLTAIVKSYNVPRSPKTRLTSHARKYAQAAREDQTGRHILNRDFRESMRVASLEGKQLLEERGDNGSADGKDFVRLKMAVFELGSPESAAKAAPETVVTTAAAAVAAGVYVEQALLNKGRFAEAEAMHDELQKATGTTTVATAGSNNGSPTLVSPPDAEFSRSVLETIAMLQKDLAVGKEKKRAPRVARARKLVSPSRSPNHRSSISLATHSEDGDPNSSRPSSRFSSPRQSPGSNGHGVRCLAPNRDADGASVGLSRQPMTPRTLATMVLAAFPNSAVLPPPPALTPSALVSPELTSSSSPA